MLEEIKGCSMMHGGKDNGGRILLRFDDICPTMKWDVWDEIEKCLKVNHVQPLLAIIPDNKDPKIAYEPAKTNFWEQVRNWQSMGWSIAMHGYQHLYVTHEPGMMNRVLQSEFAGLPFLEQEQKIRRGLEIFRRENVRVDLWIAPSHSFDNATVRILAESRIKVISDGPWRLPFRDDNGILWVPQRLFDLQPVPEGIWTVCYHPNWWTKDKVNSFRRQLPLYVEQITNLERVIADYSEARLCLREIICGRAILLKRAAKLAVKQCIRSINKDWASKSAS